LPNKPLLRRLKPSQSQWLSAGKGAQVSNFTDPDSKEEYAVVVNPDLVADQTVTALVAAKAGVLEPEVVDVVKGKPVKLEGLGWAGGNHRISIALRAGEGVLLKLKP